MPLEQKVEVVQTAQPFADDAKKIDEVLEEKLKPYELPKEIIPAVPLEITSSIEEGQKELEKEIKKSTESLESIPKPQVYTKEVHVTESKKQEPSEKFTTPVTTEIITKASAVKPRAAKIESKLKGDEKKLEARVRVSKYKPSFAEQLRDLPHQLKRAAFAAAGTFIVAGALSAFLLYIGYKDLKKTEKALEEKKGLYTNVLEKARIKRYARELAGRFFYSDELEKRYGIKIRGGKHPLTEIISCNEHYFREEINLYLSSIEIKVLERKYFFSTPLRDAKKIPGSYFGAVGRVIGGRVDNSPHDGQDFDSDTDSLIYASADGKVAKVIDTYIQGVGYGKYVDITHKHGENYYKTRYAHNKRNLVQEGDSVRRGDPVAVIGRTGRATGPHVHFEVHRNGHKLNPLRYVAPTEACEEAENLNLLEEFWKYIKEADPN
ncbi:MAG: peptidoglycan DD-metalloendopeptidase family protein [Candidatus Pacearchaeota archaeon]|nr:peptidoglycan DD-metalloendopeptidase family protein [Candidatus Pacearchaeota archaeon]